jgi:hypothetical protein
MFEYGQIVKVQTFRGGIVERRVVGGAKGTVYLCNESEFVAAEKEKRKPDAIGFPLADVIPDREGKAESN